MVTIPLIIKLFIDRVVMTAPLKDIETEEKSWAQLLEAAPVQTSGKYLWPSNINPINEFHCIIK